MQDTPMILFEDNHLLVAVKPPNMLTQGDDTGDADMLSLLKKYLKETYDKPGEAYLGLVHRMDRPVGGVLVFAKTSKAAARLSEQVRTHALCREYVCVCEGDAQDRFTLVDYLVKDEKTNMVRVVPKYMRDGKEAILHAAACARLDGQTLLAVRLETGRAHQIRVQLKHAGLPIFGDNRYGSGKPGQQVALWGMRLTLAHPITGKKMLFIAPPPEDGAFGKFRREIQGLKSIWPNIAP